MAATAQPVTNQIDAPLRVLLADDQAWLRSAVRLLLEQEPDIVIVGEAVDTSALKQLTDALRPDIVLLDWELPGLRRARGGRVVMDQLRRVLPKLQIIVLSGRPESLRTAAHAGATASVSKADPPEQLLTALRKAQQSAKMQSA